jgi:predicted lactoylglutathione lyase
MLHPNVEVSPNSDLTELVQQVNHSPNAIALSVEGEQKAVILSMEAFQQLIGAQINPQMSKAEFQQQFRQALMALGFDTREKIVDLVREAKREVAEEYELYAHLSSSPLI